jgi:hypothetical protein
VTDVAATVRRWFSLTEPVDRGFYLTSGISLAAIKYAVDVLLLWAATGIVWSPLLYVNPSWGTRTMSFGEISPWVVWAMVIWSLPFLWIGTSMTMRRAVDAGLSPWVGTLFFFPVVNWLAMALLSFLDSAPRERPYPAPVSPSPAFVSGARAAGIGAMAGFAVTAISVFAVSSYGGALFVGGPFLMGMIAAYLFNREARRSPVATLLVAESTLLFAGGCLLLTAVEGVFCLLMALPIATPLAALGGMMGAAMAASGHHAAPTFAGLLFLLPVAAGIEFAAPPEPERPVTTTIVVDAPPEAVWPNVIGFSDLPPPHELPFQLGIAHPLRARIDGGGVGAVRHCEFSTGAFVEPITVWDEPHVLAFDVAAQPPSMDEWSPYANLSPPHLADGFTAVRGEFRLTALEGGRTRLDGTTWYRSRLAPVAYWRLWSDALVHAIHRRVLAHVKNLSEDA